MESILKWFKSFLALEDKYGFWRIIRSCLLLVFFGYAVYLTCNPSVIFERYSAYEEQKHTESFNKRMNSSPVVSSNVNALVAEVSALRGFVIEMHNGKYNAGGLSFNYGIMSYEGVRENVESVTEDYDDFTLDRFPLLLYVYKNDYWFGSIEDLAKIDKRLALKLESNGAYYLALKTIYGKKTEIGFIGVTFAKDDKIDTKNVKFQLHKYSGKIATLLDNN